MDIDKTKSYSSDVSFIFFSNSYLTHGSANIYVLEACIWLLFCLAHWVRVARIYASISYAIIGSDNGLSHIQHLAIICNNAGLLSIGSFGT